MENKWEKLELFYNYYMHLKSEFKNNSNPEYFTGEAGNPNNPVTRLHEFMIALYGYNGFPKVVSDEEFNQIDARTYYHGYKDFDHGANLLTHYNYHTGEGFYGRGLYLTNNKKSAFDYTLNKEFDKNVKSMDRVLELKIDNNSKRIFNKHLASLIWALAYNEEVNQDNATDEEIEVIESVRKFVNEKISTDEEREDFLRVFTFNNSFLAILLGVDYIEVDPGRNDKSLLYWIVLNRGKIVTCESEAKRFMDNSVNYKGGAYNPENV